MIKNKKVGTLVVIGGMLAGALGSVGLATYAQSAPAQSQVASSITNQTSDTDNVQDKGGVEVADQKGEKDGEQNDATEQITLQAKAKITSDQAKGIALGKVSGTVSSIKLGDEDGLVVYEVTIGTQEVKVNAVDGSIVKIEKSDSKDEGKDVNENDTETADGQE